MSETAIIGGGAWGTALAAHIARLKGPATLWARDAATIEAINQRHQNEKYLPGITLPDGLSATGEREALGDAETILVVVPTQALRQTLQDFAPFLRAGADLVLCAKGIERATGERTSTIAKAAAPGHPISILSGPSFAHDVARGLPTAITLAADDMARASDLTECLSGPALRLYASDDVTGVEIGGALKNVIALAVGMTRAQNLGASAEAALTTRGFAELSRIARHFGARPETLMGLSCLGDLMLTCSSPQSRNFAYGMAIGRGDDLSGLKLAEGVHTTGIAAKICADASIDAPLIDTIHAILAGKLDVKDAMGALLSRPLKAEIG